MAWFPKKIADFLILPADAHASDQDRFRPPSPRYHGCTHFIVGCDHAGFGSTYGPLEAHDLFQQFDTKEVGITPVFYDNAFFCKACGGMATVKTCCHTDVARLTFSGTAVREMLQKGKPLPQEFTRAEIGVILMEAFMEKNMEQM